MTILKRKMKKTTQEEVQFMGVYVPKNMASYFSLYCLSIGMTKSHVLKSMIFDWIKSSHESLPKDLLIRNIAQKAFEVWNHPVGKKKNFNTFKSELGIELRYKGLGDYVEKIIEIIEDEKRKEE